MENLKSEKPFFQCFRSTGSFTHGRVEARANFLIGYWP